MSTRRSVRKSQKKMAANGALDNVSITSMNDLFWDINNYKRTVKRIDDGALLCDEVVKMVSERAEIEAKYAKKLTAWEEKWRKSLEGGPMYATMKNAYLGVLKEAHERAAIHIDCNMRLNNQVIEAVRRFKTENYHKGVFGGWKETKDIDEEFRKAQKQWSEAYNKVQAARKNYHNSCRERETASQSYTSAKSDSAFPPEKLKKLEEAFTKHERNADRLKSKYEEKLQRIAPINTSYEDEMIKVFEKCQRKEERRLNFMQDMLVEFHKCVNISEDQRLPAAFKEQIDSANSADVKHDLQWWSENYGADMPRNWPRFEEYGEAPPTPVMPAKSNGQYDVNAGGYMVQDPPYASAEDLELTQNRPLPDPMGINNPFMNGPADSTDDDWDEPPEEEGTPVRALYDYTAVEDDELTFREGDVITKLSEEDANGWCKGRFNNQEGLFPAKYAAPF